MESLRGHPAIAPTADQRATPRRVLLLLATLGDRWGHAATEAGRRSGFDVRRTTGLDDLLHALAAPPSDDRLTAAVLVSASSLGDVPSAAWTDLVERTAAADVALVVLHDPSTAGRLPLECDDDAWQHVLTLETEPSERALEVLLGAARLECTRRHHVRELKAELRAAGEREQRLLARVGHELRNPLGAITSALCLMREGDVAKTAEPERERPPTEPTDESLAAYRHLIERQVEQLSRAVDELLAVTHPAAPRTEDAGHAGPPAAAANDDGAATVGRQKAEDDRNAPPRPRGDGTPVLLVEDDPDGRQALSELLSMWGYAVQVAADGEAGVELAAELAPAVALVDIGLPGIDGYEVARRIRRDHPTSPPLLVAMTGFGQPEDRDRALDAGFDLHLVKPVRPSRLAALLAERG